ncbi:hypothetical protein CLOM_g9486 [Closterium sp. NIES-68]|nr:hypothetical protein CLOM_g9486 [Closterium sp. NIES-68]
MDDLNLSLGKEGGKGKTVSQSKVPCQERTTIDLNSIDSVDSDEEPSSSCPQSMHVEQARVDSDTLELYPVGTSENWPIHRHPSDPNVATVHPSTSVPVRANHRGHTQQRLNFAPPPSGKKRKGVSAVEEEPTPPTDLAEASSSDPPIVVEELLLKKWIAEFPWLRLQLEKSLGKYGMKCSVCEKWAADKFNTPFGRPGLGRHDIPISMYPILALWLVELGLEDMPRVEKSGTYFTTEALAAKDAASKLPDLEVVDQVIKTTAEQLGRSNVRREKFLNLQYAIRKTDLQVLGMIAIWWLSRGEAVMRFCEVLPILLWIWNEEEHALFKTATSFKFHFMLAV